jgi:hypothetical protein
LENKGLFKNLIDYKYRVYFKDPCKREELASFSLLLLLLLSLPLLLPSLKNIEGKSVYSYSLSPSPPPSFRRKHTKKVYRSIEEAYRGKEAHGG